MTTPEQNIAIMRRFITEVQEKGNISLIEELIHPDFHDHTPEDPSWTGREGIQVMVRYLHAALSTIRVEVIHCVSTGDIVATQKILHGTHTGEFFGKVATGGEVRMRIMDFVRIEDGMVREHWATLGSLEVNTEE